MKDPTVLLTDSCLVQLLENGSVRIGDDNRMNGMDSPATIKHDEIPKLIQFLVQALMFDEEVLADSLMKAHGAGQEQTIKDVNEGRIDGLIAKRLNRAREEGAEDLRLQLGDGAAAFTAALAPGVENMIPSNMHPPCLGRTEGCGYSICNLRLGHP